MLDGARRVARSYALLPLRPHALPVQQRVQGNRVGIQGDGWWPLICQMGCELLSGVQVIVLQHCPVNKWIKKKPVQDNLHSDGRHWRQFISTAAAPFSSITGLIASFINDTINQHDSW